MPELAEIIQSHWVHRAVFVVGGFVLGYLVERVVVSRLHALALETRFTWDDLLVSAIRWLPTVWLSAAGLYFASTLGDEPAWVVPIVSHALTITLIGSVAVGGMRLAKGAVESMSATATGSVASPSLVVNLAQGAVAVLGLFIILQNLGIDITPLITALGIGGLAVALALQDTLGNLFAGVQIILSRQVRPRDYVQLSSGEEGWVTDVRARNTTIQTFPDGNLVSVPNSSLASASVKNYNLPRPTLWVTVAVGVSYASDLEHVEQVALDVARGVLRDFEGGVPGEDPVLLFNAFADSSINFEVRMMVREFRSQGPIRHEFIKRIHRRFGEEGIEIPFPMRTVVMRGGGDQTSASTAP